MTQPTPVALPVDADVGSAYEQLCTEMLIDPVQLSAEIRDEILTLLPSPAPPTGATDTVAIALPVVTS